MTPKKTSLTLAVLTAPALIAGALCAPVAATPEPRDTAALHLNLVGRYLAPRTPALPALETDDVRAESHAVSGRLLVTTNHTSIDLVDISDPSSPTLIRQVDLSSFGGTVTSVAVSRRLIAATVPATDKTAPGTVVLLSRDGDVRASVTVGSLPDMVTFDKEGERLIVANEGEPSGYGVGATDPEGSVSIIDVSRALRGRANAVRKVSFSSVDAGSLNNYVRVFGPGATIAQDFEPEYITVQGSRAYVTLQENNAIAVIDLERARLLGVHGLEFKDYSASGNEFDPSDREISSSQGAVAIANWPVWGMPLPDGIASYRYRGRTLLVTANEGDSRDYDGYSEETRIKDIGKASPNPNLPLDPGVFLDPLFPVSELVKDAKLGRLKVSTAGADSDANGKTDRLLSFGTRSITIWTTDGTKVWDSGDILEREIAGLLPANFNSDNQANNFDNRSDDKGPEPEGVVVGRIGHRTYAFVGLERVGGLAVFDVTSPSNATFVEYVTSRDFSLSPTDGSTDSGPEVVSFVPAGKSPNRRPMVVVSNEWSGSITLWQPAS